MKSQTTFFALLFLILISSSFLFSGNDPIWERFSNHSPNTKKHSIEKPEYQIKGFHSKQFSPAGVLASTLEAESLAFYKSSKISTLQNPYIQVFPENYSTPDTPPEWVASAVSASSVEPNQHITLSKKVNLKQLTPPAGEQPLDIYSEKMDLLLDRKIAKSDSKVTIKSENNIISGKIFESQLQTNYLSLKADVTSRYLPKNARAVDALVIQSNSFLIEDNGTRAIYTGDVKLSKTGIHIYAEKVEIVQLEGKEVAYAYGNPTTFEQLPSSGQKPVTAHAKRFEFDSTEEILKMYEQAKLTQGKATVEGDYLFYDTQTENIGAESKPNNRVKMVLPNNENNDK